VGLLHDAAEDRPLPDDHGTGGRRRLEQIRTDFGAGVARVVEGCSEPLDRFEARDDSDWLIRKKAYLDKLRAESPEVRRVSLADKLHNARCTVADIENGEVFDPGFHANKGRQSWYYAALLTCFRDANTKSRYLQEFGRLVERINSEWSIEIPVGL